MQNIGVMGGKWTLPQEFPATVNGNSGDMIHTMAPLSILTNSVYSTDPRVKLSGARNFRGLVNDHGSHLVLVLANVLRNGVLDGSNYAKLQHALEQYTKPIVVFGLGMQAASTDLDAVSLPQEAVELMQFLSSRSEALGVRGPFTKQVLEEICGVKNAYVTGCPSLYARPAAIRELREGLRDGAHLRGRFSFNVTNLARPDERTLLTRGIQYDGYLIEPVSRIAYEYHLALQGSDQATLPYYFKSMLPDSQYGLSERRVQEFYRHNLRLFRQPEPWLDFNRDYVSWSYGTRFHVNMATLLAGRPALWLTHDSRTEELARFMHLPHAPLNQVAGEHPTTVAQSIDYDDFFDHVNGLFENFSEYLKINGLDGLKAPL